MLVPVQQNEDGSLVVSGDIINLPKDEVAVILNKSREIVTPHEVIAAESQETSTTLSLIEPTTDVIIEQCFQNGVNDCFEQNAQFTVTDSSAKESFGFKDLYESAKTPPDIINLNITLPITDQIAQQSNNANLAGHYVESEINYQTPSRSIKISQSRCNGENAPETCEMELFETQSMEVSLQKDAIEPLTVNQQKLTVDAIQGEHTINPTFFIVQNMPNISELDGLQDSVAEIQADIPDSRTTVEEQGELGEEDEHTDILSRVIAEILTDNQTYEEADEQIINVMQGEVTVTSTKTNKRCAMELLEAVLLMSSAVNPQPEAQLEISERYVTSGNVGQLSQNKTEENSTEITENVEENYSTNFTNRELEVSDDQPMNLPKTPNLKYINSKKRYVAEDAKSPENKVLKIKNSIKDPSIVRQMFKARKRLFNEAPVLCVGPSTLVEQSTLLLQKNEILLAEAMDNITVPAIYTEDELSRIEDTKSPTEEDCERSMFLSPYRDTLFSESPVRMSSPISPLTITSPCIHDSPKFMFLASSPTRSKTPDHNFLGRAKTPDHSLFHKITGESSPLFHRSPDNFRSNTPEMSNLETPDHSKLGTLSFGHDPEEPTFDDNFICDLDPFLAFK